MLLPDLHKRFISVLRGRLRVRLPVYRKKVGGKKVGITSETRIELIPLRSGSIRPGGRESKFVLGI